MTKEDVKLYGDMFKELGLTELKVCNKESEFLLKKEVKVVSTYDVEKENIIEISQEKHSDSHKDLSMDVVIENKAIDDKTVDINAPLVGVFYAAPSPDAEPYVKVGDKISKGDVICVLEAMKMFNEIKSEVSGTVTQICVDNGNIVEYGQTIMKVSE